MKKVTASQMQELDRRAQQDYGIPGLILMENAGLRASETAVFLLKKKSNKKVVIFCGPGNNGGDGFVVARHILNKGLKVKIFILGDEKKIKGDALINFIILKKMRADIIRHQNILKEVNPALKGAGIVIDAIFGIGLNKEVKGVFREVINFINTAGKTVLALDTPSGLCAATGNIFGVCVLAHTTVTFGAAKKGFYLKKGKQYVGKLLIADISFPRQLLNP
ncbi:MAG: NAD(P)H-hydrate epimerase [Candidatus Omnitrophota bacterium]